MTDQEVSNATLAQKYELSSYLDHCICRAAEAKRTYLQCRAVAWHVLYEYITIDSENERQVQQIYADTLKIATHDEWMDARATTQVSQILIGRDQTVANILHDEVPQHLKNYKGGSLHWSDIVGMLLQESRLQRELYLLWRTLTIREIHSSDPKARISDHIVQLRLVSDGEVLRGAKTNNYYLQRTSSKTKGLLGWIKKKL